MIIAIGFPTLAAMNAAKQNSEQTHTHAGVFANLEQAKQWMIMGACRHMLVSGEYGLITEYHQDMVHTVRDEVAP